MIILEVAALPPQPAKTHWGIISRAKTSWATSLSIQAHQQKLVRLDKPTHRNVHVIFQHPGPKMDDDNRAARCKVPLDALVRADLLWDDAPTYCTLTTSCITTRDTRTIIHLSEGTPL